VTVVDVPFPKPGLLYRLYGDDREGTYIRLSVVDGRVLEEMISIGPNGPGSVEGMFWGPAETLQQHLVGLHRDLIGRKTGVSTWRHTDSSTDNPVDLDGLNPAAKQELLDEFAADLEARRQPRDRPRRSPDAASVPVPEPPVEPVNSHAVELEPAVSREVTEAAKRVAVMVRELDVVSKRQLGRGMVAGAVDRYLAYAVAQEWVVVDGDVLRPGRVDPRPVTTIADVNGPSWGPIDDVDGPRAMPCKGL
jgi:hypothetical protein